MKRWNTSIANWIRLSIIHYFSVLQTHTHTFNTDIHFTFFQRSKQMKMWCMKSMIALQMRKLLSLCSNRVWICHAPPFRNASTLTLLYCYFKAVQYMWQMNNDKHWHNLHSSLSLAKIKIRIQSEHTEVGKPYTLYAQYKKKWKELKKKYDDNKNHRNNNYACY